MSSRFRDEWPAEKERLRVRGRFCVLAAIDILLLSVYINDFCLSVVLIYKKINPPYFLSRAVPPHHRKKCNGECKHLRVKQTCCHYDITIPYSPFPKTSSTKRTNSLYAKVPPNSLREAANPR